VNTVAVRVARHESALGRWVVTTIEPHPLLRDAVRHIWHGEGRVAYARDRILPAAQTYLLFNLGPPQYVIERGARSRRVPFDDVWFCGIAEQPIDAEAPNGSTVVGVEFTSSGAGAVLPCPQAELANRIAPLADLIGLQPARLRERLLNTEGAVPRLALVHDWLLERYVTGRRVHPLVHWATQRLAVSAGALRAAALAHEAGCSRKHMAALFKRDVGLTPKTLAKVHRFQQAVAALRSGTAPSLTEIALACGYYDQSHFIRDFERFAGMAPGAFAGRPMPDAKSVVVG
jgi:AraC-like DNA-binding protein